MTRALYVIGGAGTGKSTFMESLLLRAGAELGPLEEFHALRNKKNLVKLRGHTAAPSGGVYLGVMRESFPGSDGLDRVCGPVGEAWLDTVRPLPPFIVGEGATLATRRFLAALARNSALLVVHLEAGEAERQRRFAERGSAQDPSFVRATATRAANLAEWCGENGMSVLPVDTEDEACWDLALDLSETHIRLD